MKLFSSKKGDLGLSLNEQIIGLVLAFALILVTLSLFFGLLNIFTAKADPGSINSFNNVYGAVNALYDEENTHQACWIPGHFLKADWAVVGFNADCVQTADYDFYCVHGDECVEEQCSGLFSGESNIDKPSWCGTGPCICLCNGGVVGDIDGDDCAEDNSKCRKFPPDSKFSTFYFIDPDEGECERSAGVLGLDRPGSLCDLVIDSEDCSGRNRGVIYAVVISRSRSVSPVKPGCGLDSGHDAVVFDLVKTEREFKSAYGEGMIECSKLMRELMKAPEKSGKPAGEDSEDPSETDKGETVVDQIQRK